MPRSNLERGLMGAAGAVGAGIVAWQTQFPWIKYDIQFIKSASKVKKIMETMAPVPLIDQFEGHVTKQPHKAMVLYEGCVYTYEFMEQQANKVAHMARQLGWKLGDSVAIMIKNEPAFIWTVLGLMKLGITTAWLNYNLRLNPLCHSVLATEPKGLIVGSGEDLLQAVVDIRSELGAVPVYVQNLSPDLAPTGVNSFDELMRQALPVRPDPSVREQLTPASTALYIYTSGTTGLPKPVFISHMKTNGIGSLINFAPVSSEDVFYTCLPLYHTAGGGMGLFTTLALGCTMVLKDKFSASRFWSDCQKYKVTIVQYIGEIFRYILSQPATEHDSVHNVRIAYGNGLRKDVFEQVLKRFKIPQIVEFYGATEGPTALVNIANRPGAIGRLSPFLNMIDPDPKYLVKYDMATATPIRDKNGRCIKVKTGEPGLLITRVPDLIRSNNNLTVYKASSAANEKKLVRNAFKEGDLFFNYGDVLFTDSDHFAYFSDRIGDTFRWKGENVSTNEVSNVLCVLDFLVDANVYGVTIPGHDGRAGMAALTLKDGEHLTPQRLKQIFKLCQADLPAYARPLFLRQLPESVLTGTFKQKKVDLQKEAYDLDKVKDVLYYLDVKAETYSPLTRQGLVSFLQSRL